MRCSPRPPATALMLLALTASLVAGCSSSEGSSEAFCAQVAEVPALESVLSRFSETDPAVLQDRIDKARAAYQELASAAPDDITKATDDVVAVVDELLDAVERHPDDPNKAASQVRADLDAHPDIEANRATVTAYARRTCDVQLDATLSTGGSSTSTSAATSTSTSTSTSTPGG